MISMARAVAKSNDCTVHNYTGIERLYGLQVGKNRTNALFYAKNQNKSTKDQNKPTTSKRTKMEQMCDYNVESRTKRRKGEIEQKWNKTAKKYLNGKCRCSSA